MSLCADVFSVFACSWVGMAPFATTRSITCLGDTLLAVHTIASDRQTVRHRQREGGLRVACRTAPTSFSRTKYQHSCCTATHVALQRLVTVLGTLVSTAMGHWGTCTHPRPPTFFSVLWVCGSVCLSVREVISGITRATFTIFCACYLCPWLGPPPTCLR